MILHSRCLDEAAAQSIRIRGNHNKSVKCRIRQKNILILDITFKRMIFPYHYGKPNT